MQPNNNFDPITAGIEKRELDSNNTQNNAKIGYSAGSNIAESIILPKKIKPVYIQGNFIPFFGGTAVKVGDSKLYDESIKITTPGNALSGIKSSIGKFNGGIRLIYKMKSWAELTEFTIRIIDNGDKSATLNMRSYFASPSNNEWHDLAIPVSAFEKESGFNETQPSYTLYVRINASAESFVQIDEIASIEAIDKAIVTTTFDDGYADTIIAAKLMNKYGFRGTSFIMLDYIGRPNYMTQEQIDYLASIGWGIGGHHQTNLTTMSPTTLDGELSKVRTYLEQHKYAGREHFAYPNGAHNALVDRTVSKYFSTARTIDGFNQPIGCAIRESINSKETNKDTPTQTLIDWVSEAVERKEWVNLNFHMLKDTASTLTEYSISGFIEVLEALYQSGVTLIPYHEAIAKLGIIN